MRRMVRAVSSRLRVPKAAARRRKSGLLAAWLRDQGEDVVTTREPGGTRIGDGVRALLLDPAHTEMQPETEILLFSAARAQIVGQVIRPHLATRRNRPVRSLCRFDLGLPGVRAPAAPGDAPPDHGLRHRRSDARSDRLPRSARRRRAAAQTRRRSGRMESDGAGAAGVPRTCAAGISGAGSGRAGPLAGGGCDAAGGCRCKRRFASAILAEPGRSIAT